MSRSDHPEHAPTEPGAVPSLRPSDTEIYLRRLLAANEPSQAVQVAVEHVATELGCPVSWVGVIKGDRLVMAGQVGLTSTEMVTAWHLRVGDGIGGRVAEHRRPHMSRDYRHDSRRVPLMKRLIDNEGIQATLTVPLLSADEALGVLYAAHHRPYPWSDHELTMLEQIAQDLATRLRQLDVDGRTGRRRDAAERERRRAVESHQRFGAFATSLGAQDDPEGILDLLAREVRVGVTLTRDGHPVFHSPALGESDDQPTVAEFDLEDTDGLALALQRGQDLDELDRASATLGAALFRVQWLRLAERERTVERLSASLMDQLLTGRVTDPHDVHRRASLLGLRLTPGRVWVVGSRTGPDRLAAFEERLRQAVGACLTTRRGSRLVVVAAAATGTTMEVEWDSVAPYLPIQHNQTLAARWATRGRKVLPDGVVPETLTGSTDLGNLSTKMPAIHPMLAIAPPEVALQTAEFAGGQRATAPRPGSSMARLVRQPSPRTISGTPACGMQCTRSSATSPAPRRHASPREGPGPAAAVVGCRPPR